MRIAFANHSRRKVGGAEVYVGSVLPAFVRSGQEVAWLCESDQPCGHEAIPCPAGVPSWCVSALGVAASLRELAGWRPDIVYGHGIVDNDFHSALLEVAPAVLYVHNYYGSCISGSKMHAQGVPRICERTFGPRCLLHYFPDHCGGRNPLTMWSEYRQQRGRLDLMRRYRGLVANSNHIAGELARYDLKTECVYPFTSSTPTADSHPASLTDDHLQLIFAGRMTTLKGGDYLLRAAPEAQRRLGRRLHIIFVGDGPERTAWQLLAERLRNDNLTFAFPGWLDSEALRSATLRSHLHVYPSIWPEPFGLSGLEAGLLGVPTVAFAVGGIPEWLHDGVNGHLAPAPVSATGLAEAIARALSTPEHHQSLSRGAGREAQRYSLDEHLAKLIALFERCRA